ncbi:CMP-N-acetylneuraminic acid synthetase [Campylobacter insulaenigrae]|uniref:pseudaminic acid cytidylyltransferase n=1 Tax=Campylobacter insulaenigrae TaxID=260714 RepID=UPI000F6C2CAF|nr:pseudaminic acid cytidylyltransferase [Campylobacter insulaenigrae]MCR6591938.1 pseudaminic acid cytidylyltransferase [Campylobacter insulaenigrae]MCR6593469.1 pseudaminic acid cytidylyltransferase [Campylobacter insulaenigrae]VEJ55104.1 CMP-N-acetylneuraminic acid synthetase [Campylobacter insulaenigrae]
MKNICIIPARGGSKRIPKKNIVDFLGQPLITYSITNALKSGIFDDVIVSSDNDEIITIAQNIGAKTPFIRDAKLSDDYTSSTAVIKDAIIQLENLGYIYDNVCCLYATAPLIDENILKQAYNQFIYEDCNFLFSACEFEYPIQRAFYTDQDNKVYMFDEKFYYTRSQDLTKAYHDAGAFYFGKKDAWLKQDFMFKPYSKAFLLPKNQVCDIDTYEDLELAKFSYQFKQGKQCL